MPKISAPTVKEHRAAVQAKLIDAAERILRTDGAAALTAGSVTAQAGIARNSIYRYVDSVDDLRGMVLRRYLPRWQEAVNAEIAGVEPPRERVLAWVRANLREASRAGHGWLVQVAEAARLHRGLSGDLDSAHQDGQDFLAEGLRELGLRDMPIRVRMIRSIVNAGFKSLDEGESLEDVDHWAEVAVAAILDASRN